MRRFVLTVFILGSACIGLQYFSRLAAGKRVEAVSGVAHDVFFSLKDAGEVAKIALVADSQKYLGSIPGIVSYAAGTRSDMERDVNDRNFDVSLHIVFQDKAALQEYLVHPMHTAYVARHEPNCQKIRVFNSELCDPR
ncbi:MAG: Dabb family protein [Pirellulales bacterium]|nr:Dabb family protein [Pirellulales bacterium]